jgi:alkyldihydroxyacetonephosphate synthase
VAARASSAAWSRCAGPFDAVIALDLRRLDRLVSVDERSLTAVFEPGLRLPQAEAALAGKGLTLGHFPQSYEYATVGGCVATRSAGQASTGYGRIDELVLGATLAAPSGDVVLPVLPASAAGPDLRELVVGSEGALGVITTTALRVRPVPAERRYEGFFFGSFAEGAEAFRILEQSGAAPHVARLSDEDETRVSLAMAGGGWKARALGGYLRARRVSGGCLAICGWEGTAEHVHRARGQTVALLKAGGAVPLGGAPGSAWAKGRYHGPYLRDDLLGRGVFVETLETATQWSNLDRLHRAVGDALRGALERPIVMCHISHLYPSGASLYFTFFAKAADGGELDQWQRAKRAATEAIVASGGTITHHHAVGRDHAEWLPAEASAHGIAALRAVKDELDPAGVMNREAARQPCLKFPLRMILPGDAGFSCVSSVTTIWPYSRRPWAAGSPSRSGPADRAAGRGSRGTSTSPRSRTATARRSAGAAVRRSGRPARRARRPAGRSGWRPGRRLRPCPPAPSGGVRLIWSSIFGWPAC